MTNNAANNDSFDTDLHPALPVINNKEYPIIPIV